MSKTHQYQSTVRWTGNTGSGTSEYKSYERSHVASVAGKPDILCSSDPAFRGDAGKYNPEDLLVASISGCHMLWYLHLCAVNGVVVTSYEDKAVGVMNEHADGSGEFSKVILRPKVEVASSEMIQKANELHDKAREFCFVARTVNFEVSHEPTATSKN